MIALCGCTASGKTALGVHLAQLLDTEIISVDSMSVYRGMDIGTAKPTVQEREGVVHHLLDVVEPDEPFTAADFVSLSRPIIERLHAAGKPILLVGGTGLYLRTLVHGMFEGPGADLELRARYSAEQEAATLRGEPAWMLEQLRLHDPLLASRLHPNDHVRILRGLEVFAQSGKPLSSWQAEHAFQNQSYEVLKLALLHEREVLNRRIDLRAVRMLSGGLLEETAALLARYGAEVKPMKGLGYLHATAQLEGRWTPAETLERLQLDTRHFARRQLTWFKSERGVEWLPPDFETLRARVHKFLES